MLCETGSRSHWQRYDNLMQQGERWRQSLLQSFWADVQKVKDVVDQSNASVAAAGQSRASVLQAWYEAHLLENCAVLRLGEFKIYRLSTVNDGRHTNECGFLTSDKDFHRLPDCVPAVHVEYTDYFFPKGIEYPRKCQLLVASLVALAFSLCCDWMENKAWFCMARSDWPVYYLVTSRAIR